MCILDRIIPKYWMIVYYNCQMHNAVKTDQLKMFDLHDDWEGVRMTDEREYKQVLLLSLHIIYSIKPL